SEDDGTERIPPKPSPGATPAGPDRHEIETGETAAERRRREGALGIRHEEESDSDDDDTPRQVPQSRGIRFADEAPPHKQESSPQQQQQQQGGEQSRPTKLRWGRNVGR
ncbi:hypothetical protein KC336_g22732, partial [Hortaea werneckii]